MHSHTAVLLDHSGEGVAPLHRETGGKNSWQRVKQVYAGELVLRRVELLKEISHWGEKQRQIGTQMLLLEQKRQANAITQNAL